MARQSEFDGANARQTLLLLRNSPIADVPPPPFWLFYNTSPIENDKKMRQESAKADCTSEAVACISPRTPPMKSSPVKLCDGDLV